MRTLIPLALGLTVLSCQRQAPEVEDDAGVHAHDGAAPALARNLDRARALYQDHCALCHGGRGEGDGPAAALLHPPARDFTLGFNHLATTENAVPSEDDLVRTLREGMPGSAMPSFAWMAEHDLQDLAHLVREQAREGLVVDLFLQAEERGVALDPAEADEIVERWLTPGEKIEPLPPADPTPQLLAQGRRLFLRDCAACHGLDGSGRSSTPQRHEDGSLTWARDFTAGILKGGGSRYDLTCRIRAGMGGATMPPSDLSELELAALVAYVQDLIPAGTPDRHRQVRTRIDAPRLEGPPTADDWSIADEVQLPLAPMNWKDESILSVRVQALHDRQRVWVRMRWEDEFADDRVVGGSPFVDSAAVQIAQGPQQPLFGMGREGHPANLWHWSAARWTELAGLLDPLSSHGTQDASDAPLFRAPQTGGATALEAQGFDEIRESGGSLEASSSWKDGTWEVVFARDLRQQAADEVHLRPGGAVSIAFAIWNGAAGDHRGEKSITIWHELRLAR